jgi:hypothetical protein
VKKLRTRPPRFVALDNRAVDDLRLSVLDVCLLAVALRCPDGPEFTVASLAHKRKPGREALTGAMRNLVACGYVVKLKVQDVATGMWRTQFSVADLPFSREDIGDMLADVADAQAIRVEPAWLDPRTQTSEQPPVPALPTQGTSRADRVTGSRHSGTTSTNTENPQVTPTDGFPTVGEPTVGEPSAKRRRLHVQDEKDSSLSLSAGAGGEREISHSPGPLLAAVQAPAEAACAEKDEPDVGPSAAAAARALGERIAQAWAKAREERNIAVPVLGHKRVAKAAARLNTAGMAEHLLLQAAIDMARQASWLDLERHLERWSPPQATPAASPGPRAYCGQCDHGWIDCEDGRASKCPCRTPSGPPGRGQP